MGFVPDGYYSFEALDGSFNGLVRISGGDHFEYVGEEGVWINDQEIALHFVDPGSDDPLVPVDDATAQRLAARYGVII